MKVMLDVKSNQKIIVPSKDNVILYDGKDWYITTKQDIFHEYEDKMNAKIAEISALIDQMQQFKREIAGQMVEMSELIRQLVAKEGE